MDDPPGRGSPWARTTAVIVLAALLGGAAGFGVWALARDDTTARTTSTVNSPSTPPASVSAAGPEDDTGSGPNGDSDPDPTPGSDPDPTPGSDQDPTPGSDQDPDRGDAPGYVRADDPAGFTVDVPVGWDRTAKTPEGKPAVVTYESPDGTRVLQLFEVSEATPAESLELAETADYGFARLPGYRVLDRSATDDTSSEVVYRFDGEGDLGPRQVVDHRFRTAGDKIYGVRFSVPESTPPDEAREPVAVAVASLCPTGATCVRG